MGWLGHDRAHPLKMVLGLLPAASRSEQRQQALDAAPSADRQRD
jgi:hypothetical protein